MFSFLVLVSVTLAAVPSELTEALKTFRTDPPKGWSYTQSTTEGTTSLVEHYDAARPEFERWTILQKDGRNPTDDEQRDYKEKLTRRHRAAPHRPTGPRVNRSCKRHLRARHVSVQIETR